jgi:hypothetical protein
MANLEGALLSRLRVEFGGSEPRFRGGNGVACDRRVYAVL